MGAMARSLRVVGCLTALVLALGLGLGLGPHPAAAQDEVDFRLELDTGGHRGAVRGLAFSADGQWLFSASDDKTVRIWDWRAGRPAGTLRGFQGEAEDGMIFALAPSADGEHVATAGFLAPFAAGEGYGTIRLHARRNGQITGLLEGRRLPVYGLAYAPETDVLVAVGHGPEVHRWVAPFSDAPQPLPVIGANAARMDAVAFALDGARLVAVTADFGLRLWDAASGDPVEPADAATLNDANLRSLAVSADGTRIAIAGERGLVQVRAAEDGALLADLGPFPFRPGALAFAGEDRLLVVSCGYGCGREHRAAVWDWQEGAQVGGYDALDGLAVAATAAPDGALVATSGGPRHEIHVWAPETGATQSVLVGEGAPKFAVAIDARGEAIAWGSADPCPDDTLCPSVAGPLDHRMRLPTPDRQFDPPELVTGEEDGWLRAVLKADGHTLEAMQSPGSFFEADTLVLRRPDNRIGGLRREPTDGYYHSAFTLVQGGTTLISGGGNGYLAQYGRDDLRLRHVLAGHSADILAMAVAPAPGLLLTGSADQTLRLWNTETGALIVSLFFAGQDWIIWTPQGYYHSSPGGDRLIGWHINQGRAREGRLVRAYQLKRHLHSPEIVRQAILQRDARAAALDLRGQDGQLQELLASPPPDFSLTLVEDLTAPDGFAVMELAGGIGTGADPLAGVSVLVNDRRVRPEPLAVAGDDRALYLVPVEDGENAILVTAENDFGYVTERGATALMRRVSARSPGRLRVAVVGVDDYPLLPTGCNGRSCDLAFPGADALAFLSVLAERTAPLHETMETLVMLNEGALSANPTLATALADLVEPGDILEPSARTITFELLDFLEAVDDDTDTTIIFIAGHGINVGEDYYIIPSDGEMRDDARWRMASLVDWRQIHAALERTPGRKILVLDTCHAANSFNQRLEKEASDARIHVFSATAANNVALERADLGHGIFTYAMLEGLRGRARTSDEGVSLFGLADYVSGEVLRLSANRQEPFFHFPQARNFVLAVP